ncbi:MAG TPA: DnaJ C-terminal domain-containing protein [Gammaproteobacteria bacterium]|nr:DnaJ C-terminal domain-containing protein [Gammaproteobacteria bacterium]
MRYKDYYEILGVPRAASAEEIKRAYRRLARKYHPDVSKEADAAEKFKDIAEAYQTLKDTEKRAAFDQLGQPRSGEQFRPPPDWQERYRDAPSAFEDMDLADLFAGLQGGRFRAGQASTNIPVDGQDYEVSVPISLADAYHGTQVNLDLSLPEYDAQGVPHRTPHTFKARIPKGASDGQRLRVPGKGGKGLNGGNDGDLYLNISLRPHHLFRVAGHDVYLDLPLAPWEAALGTSVELPTPGGPVRLKIQPGASSGRQLRLPGRGLPRPQGGAGDLFAIVQIVMPAALNQRQQELFKQLGASSEFNPRAHYQQEVGHASRTH